MKYASLILLLFGLLFHTSTAQSQTGPPIEWQKIDWAPVKPNGPLGDIVPVTAQTQAESGEDWWYAHENIYDAAENHIGYITTGYATWINKTFVSKGCTSNSLNTKIPNCRTGEDASRRFGVTRATVARYDLSGKMVWCRAFNLGTFSNVIQTSTKDGFIAIGETNSVTDLAKYTPSTTSQNVDWLSYNPTAAAPTDIFDRCGGYPNPVQRHMNVVKIDNDGNVVWNYLYGIEAYDAPNDGLIAATTRSIGTDLVEGPWGNLRCVGSATDLADNGVKKVFVVDLDMQTGYVNSMNLFGEAGTDSEAKAIALSDQNNTYAVTGYMGYTGATRSRAFASLLSPAPAFNNPAVLNPFWTVYADDFDSRIKTSDHAASWDVDFDHDNNILFPVIGNMNREPFNINIKAEGFVLTLQAASTVPTTLARNTALLGALQAYDLRLGITATSDDGFAVTSSKVLYEIRDRNDPILDGIVLPIPETTPCHPEKGYVWDSWNSDAYVAKFNGTTTTTSWTLDWDKTFDSYGQRATSFPGDVQKKECVYEITEAQDGGLVITGNTSDNFDDDYLVKISNGCGVYGPNAVVFDALGDNPEYLEIGSGQTTTLAAAAKFKGRIVVKAGGTLHITGGQTVIEFADTYKTGVRTGITVEQGGTFILDGGATLTSLSDCPDAMWDGVDVWGYENQGPTPQGRMIIDNGTIENARLAIRMAKTEFNEYLEMIEGSYNGGGILNASKATFRNCRSSIYFAPYTYSRSNYNQTQSYIRSSNFICDAPMNDPGYSSFTGERLGINYFLSMWEYHGLDLVDNNFLVLASFSEPARGIGITSFNARYSVDCDLNNCASTRNVFKGLQYGIRSAANNAAYSPKINGAFFTGNTKSIFLNRISAADITRNRFDIGTPTEYGCYGIYMVDCNAYLIEGNELSSNYPGNIGINIYNQTEEYNNWTNEVYRNDFQDLQYALFGNGFNDGGPISPTNPLQQRGLKFKCNTFTNNEYDMLSTLGHGISPNQGTPAEPAGNTFDGCMGITDGELLNGSSVPNRIWNYYHHADVQRTPEFSCLDFSKVIAFPVSFPYEDSYCEERFTSNRRERRFVDFQEAEQILQAVEAEYVSLLDAGDTQGLLDMIDSDAPAEDVLNGLLGAAPYVSDAVLLAAINDKPTPMTGEDLLTIARDNAPITANVLEAFLARNPPLEPHILEEIQQLTGGISERMILEGRWIQAQSNRQLALQEWTRAILHADDIDNSIDQVIGILELENNDAARADLISLYLADQDYSKAESMINTLQSNPAWSDYCNLQTLLLNLYSNGQNELQIGRDPNLLATVEGIAAQASAPGAMDAQAILEFITGNKVEAVFAFPALPRQAVSQDLDKQREKNNRLNESPLTVFPNPANTVLSINGLHSDKPVSVSLIDISGRILLQNVFGGKASVQLNIEAIDSGIYLLEVRQSDRVEILKIVKK